MIYTDCSRRNNLDRLAAQKALQSRVKCAVKSGDSNKVVKAKSDLTWLNEKLK